MRIIVSLVFMFALALTGQGQTVVSGGIVDADGPIADIMVKEIDHNQRVLNSTTTDASGLFTMRVNNLNNALLISGSGYLRRIERMQGRTRFDIQLLRVTHSLEEELLQERHPHTESFRLIYGRLGEHKVAQRVWIEMLNDTLFTLSLPIHAFAFNENYPVNRKMMFVDYTDGPLMTGNSIVEVYAESGDPMMRDEKSIITRYYTDGNYTPGSFSSDTQHNLYPQFVFRTTELETLLMHEDAICRILIDTSRGDNFWQLYIYPGFCNNLMKTITKLRKKLR